MARFADLPKNKLSFLLQEKEAENTKKETKVALTLLHSYLKEKGLSEGELITSKAKLAIAKFYPEARKQDGS